MTSMFESGLKMHMDGLIRQKRADGFSYVDDEYHLRKLDEFCVEHFPGEMTITRDIADRWSLIRSTEGASYRNRRVTVLRQLSLYILSLGHEAYVPRNNGKTPKPVLYIPSHKEIEAFFAATDAWECVNHCGRRTSAEYKMLFRLYYCCGLRLSEARLLKKEDVDFGKGTLTIYQSKGHKDRLVYLPPDGKEMLAGYLLYIGKAAPDSIWLFPGQNTDKPLSATAIQRRFKVCWNSLDSAASAYKYPTPHCLRHAFVVDRMNEWMRQGLDIQALLPYLSKYLGHKSPSETFYYYHLVDNAFAVVRDRDTVSARVIPEVFDYEEI